MQADEMVPYHTLNYVATCIHTVITIMLLALQKDTFSYILRMLLIAKLSDVLAFEILMH